MSPYSCPQYTMTVHKLSKHKMN